MGVDKSTPVPRRPKGHLKKKNKGMSVGCFLGLFFCPLFYFSFFLEAPWPGVPGPVPKGGASASGRGSPSRHNLAPARPSPRRRLIFQSIMPRSQVWHWHDREGQGPKHRLPRPPQPPRGWSPAAGLAEKVPSWEPMMLIMENGSDQLRRRAGPRPCAPRGPRPCSLPSHAHFYK
jgi:hypothetical protein